MYSHDYYLKNKEKYKESQRKWREKNKEKFSKLVYKYRKKRAEELKAKGITKYCWKSNKKRQELLEKNIDK